MMNIQQFNPKMVSITMLRRDMKVLEDVLAKEEEAWVMRNQSVLFVALTPEKYKRVQSGFGTMKSLEEAIDSIDKLRKGKKSFKGSPVSGYVSKMRDERVGKWKK
ncbi:hypothetical protein KKC08_01470 [Patescibacteria group bacterium]|nr:hypothetical protein [Patescibacteria group bacterium]MCG2701512.1 hypothetical protein [Candidatus Parcubacteria bacterium]MBU4209817.1 hypothetical protein [Patescibacteria group bacterium]MBU4265285.1 hypothetical protein [Patescibacteria group bacterium]MBU4389970.1 hypothetical protein [Patescibacteria group bacterium]